jgi:hypothetical protein
MSKTTLLPELLVRVRSNVPGARPAGSVATTCELLKDARGSAVPLKRTVGAVLLGSKFDPERVMTLVR